MAVGPTPDLPPKAHGKDVDLHAAQPRYLEVPVFVDEDDDGEGDEQREEIEKIIEKTYGRGMQNAEDIHGFFPVSGAVVARLAISVPPVRRV
jgi:hypothetical protein